MGWQHVEHPLVFHRTFASLAARRGGPAEERSWTREIVPTPTPPHSCPARGFLFIYVKTRCVSIAGRVFFNALLNGFIWRVLSGGRV